MRAFVTFFGLVAVLAIALTAGAGEEPSPTDLFPSITRLGPAVSDLTNDDLAQLEKLSVQPWAIRAAQPGVMWKDRRFASVFVRSAGNEGLVRRGDLLRVVGMFPREPGRNNAWSVQSKDEWVQVPVEGRPADEISGPRDLNRPFSVSGAIDDSDLYEVVRLIRLSPRIPPPPTPRKAPPTGRVPTIVTDVRGDWPILWIKVGSPTAVGVYLLDDDRHERSGQHVELTRTSSVWAVRRLTAFHLY